jgi:undecaprenyl-diphosphatase
MRLLTNMGEQTFLIPAGIVVAALLLFKRKWREGALLGAVVLGGTLLSEALKLLFRRARPDPYFGFAAPDSYAFPSGHAVSSVCFYGVLVLLLAPKLRWRGARAALWTVAAALAGLVGLSRVYLGVHYPSDVLGGYAVAVVWIAAVRLLLPMRPKPRRFER